jgi:hypothetical protein
VSSVAPHADHVPQIKRAALPPKVSTNGNIPEFISHKTSIWSANLCLNVSEAAFEVGFSNIATELPPQASSNVFRLHIFFVLHSEEA